MNGRPVLSETTPEMPAKKPGGHGRSSHGPGEKSAIEGIVSLEELKAKAAACRACDLWENATQTVFGAGAEHAIVMFVGEQPGDQEDRAGRPLRGTSRRPARRGSGRGWDRSSRGIRNERSEALQVGAAWQAKDPQEAGLAGGGSLQTLAGGRNRR